MVEVENQRSQIGEISKFNWYLSAQLVASNGAQHFRTWIDWRSATGIASAQSIATEVQVSPNWTVVAEFRHESARVKWLRTRFSTSSFGQVAEFRRNRPDQIVDTESHCNCRLTRLPSFGPISILIAINWCTRRGVIPIRLARLPQSSGWRYRDRHRTGYPRGAISSGWRASPSSGRNRTAQTRYGRGANLSGWKVCSRFRRNRTAQPIAIEVLASSRLRQRTADALMVLSAR